MATKVLVFESDAVFAGELRNELGKLGCTTQVVDDGNLGLQQAASEKPDLILLSIELPRMNGFSVCNKLKKDPGLKDVPLIIMSSESSEETFEQHRKLRTRAEDYVHKPIAFGELLRHIQTFVRISAQSVPPPSADGVIVIDDDIPVQSPDDFVTEDNGAHAAHATNGTHDDVASVDADVDAFAESAFGRLTGQTIPPAAPVPVKQNGTHSEGATSVASITATRASQRPSQRSSIPPRPAGVDMAEHERMRTDLEKTRGRASDLERDLGTAKGEIARLQADLDRGARGDSEVQRLQREVDDLKAKSASGAKGGVSSREFLDLREALNRKDKEILGLREQISKRDKEIIESQERSLILERTKSEQDDKVLATERELADARDRIDVLAADKEQAKKASEGFRQRMEKARADLEGKAQEIADVRARFAEELAAIEAAKAALQADLEGKLAAERESTKEALERTSRESEEALAAARALAEREKEEALSTREAALKSEHDAKLAALHRAHQQELEKTKAEHTRLVEETEAQHASDRASLVEKNTAVLEQVRQDAADVLAARLAEVEAQRAADVAAVEQERDAAKREHAEHVATLEKGHAEKVSALEADRDEKVTALETKTARLEADAQAQKTEADGRIAKLEEDLGEVRAELSSVEDAKRTSDSQNRTKIDELETRTAELLARVGELEDRLAEVTKARDDLDHKYRNAEDRIATFEAELASTRQELGETRSKLAAETARADRALSKWDGDKGSLERAKDALAVALAQIEEAESRPIAG